MCAHTGAKRPSDKEVQAFVESNDTDGDGKLNRDEVLPLVEKMLPPFFAKHDKDGFFPVLLAKFLTSAKAMAMKRAKAAMQKEKSKKKRTNRGRVVRRAGIMAIPLKISDGWKPPVHEKSGVDVALVCRGLKNNAYFAKISDEDLKVVVKAMSEMKFGPGDVIIREGEVGDNVYVLKSGRVECHISGKVSACVTYIHFLIMSADAHVVMSNMQHLAGYCRDVKRWCSVWGARINPQCTACSNCKRCR